MGEYFKSLLGWPVGHLHIAGDGVFPSPLFSPPLFSPSHSSLPVAAPLPSSRLLSNSPLHVTNASSPLLSPADVYTPPRSHTHHLLLLLGLRTRLCGHVTYVLDSRQGAAQSSSLLFQEGGRRWNGGGIDSLLTCHPGANHETLFQRTMFCASLANQCSTDELIPQLDEMVRVGTGELLAVLKGIASRKKLSTTRVRVPFWGAARLLANWSRSGDFLPHPQRHHRHTTLFLLAHKQASLNDTL